jgi:hypothetical protein
VRRKKSWDDDLPDTSQWQPRNDAADTFSEAFYKRCQFIEQAILRRSQNEREMTIDAFDSGPGLEDIIREELRNMCPNRYSVKACTIDDRLGRSAGDFEVAIVNDFWFPAIKPGATTSSRKVHFPIEAIYSVLEVKQTINYKTLDKAMQKLVTCHRLHRPPTEKGRIVENRREGNCLHCPTNPLFSAIIATDMSSNVTMDELVNRFYAINKTLKRKEVVRALCVLGHGTVSWGYRESDSSIKSASFMSDLEIPIIPVFYKVMSKEDCAFYQLMVILLAHLYASILGAEDIPAHYGTKNNHTLGPQDENIRLDPDPFILLPHSLH